MGDSRPLGLLYVFQVPEFQITFFPSRGFGDENCFLIAPFPDHCLYLPLQLDKTTYNENRWSISSCV